MRDISPFCGTHSPLIFARILRISSKREFLQVQNFIKYVISLYHLNPLSLFFFLLCIVILNTLRIISSLFNTFDIIEIEKSI